MTRIKRLLLILGFVILVAAIIFAIWYLFLRPLFRPGVTNTNVNNVNGTGTLPNVNVNRQTTNTNRRGQVGTSLPKPAQVANGDATLAEDISQKSTTDATIASDGQSVVYYDANEGKFFRLDPVTGKVIPISNQQFPSVQNVTWSPDSSKAVLEFPDNRKVVYDFTGQKQYTLPSQAQQFSFSGDSKQIAYAYVGSNADQNLLVTTDYTGSGTKAVAELGDKVPQVQVAWSPSNEVVGLYRKGADLTQQQVIFIGQNQENFKALNTDGRGFKGKWTPDGSKMLYTVYSEQTNWNPELHLSNAKGDAIGSGNTDLGLRTTVDKCTFNNAGTYAYCAIPDFLERGSGLYPELSNGALDTIYTINLANGIAKPVAQPVTSGFDRFSIESMFLSTDEAKLFFTDASTHHVHEVRLR